MRLVIRKTYDCVSDGKDRKITILSKHESIKKKYLVVWDNGVEEWLDKDDIIAMIDALYFT